MLMKKTQFVYLRDTCKCRWDTLYITVFTKTRIVNCHNVSDVIQLRDYYL